VHPAVGQVSDLASDPFIGWDEFYFCHLCLAFGSLLFTNHAYSLLRMLCCVPCLDSWVYRARVFHHQMEMLTIDQTNCSNKVMIKSSLPLIVTENTLSGVSMSHL
jgi:hypothetical protein